MDERLGRDERGGGAPARGSRARASGAVGSVIDPDEAWDLRRSRRREVVERIVEGAEFVAPGDRALVLAYYRDEQSVSDIARLAGEPVRALRRRLRRTVKRVLSPRFAFVAARQESWTASRRRVVRACVLEGRTLREASERLGLSLHTVRRHHSAMQAMFDDEAMRWR